MVQITSAEINISFYLSNGYQDVYLTWFPVLALYEMEYLTEEKKLSVKQLDSKHTI